MLVSPSSIFSSISLYMFCTSVRSAVCMRYTSVCEKRSCETSESFCFCSVKYLHSLKSFVSSGSKLTCGRGHGGW